MFGGNATMIIIMLLPVQTLSIWYFEICKSRGSIKRVAIMWNILRLWKICPTINYSSVNCKVLFLYISSCINYFHYVKSLACMLYHKRIIHKFIYIYRNIIFGDNDLFSIGLQKIRKSPYEIIHGRHIIQFNIFCIFYA